jgi:hypothetical protein
MTIASASEALVGALEAAEGLPVPTAQEYAARIESGLAERGYEIVRSKTARGDRQIIGYPCTCDSARGCLEHPFGPAREINP